MALTSDIVPDSTRVPANVGTTSGAVPAHLAHLPGEARAPERTPVWGNREVVAFNYTDTPASQCRFETKVGNPCGMPPLVDKDYCHAHRKQVETVVVPVTVSKPLQNVTVPVTESEPAPQVHVLSEPAPVATAQDVEKLTAYLDSLETEEDGVSSVPTGSADATSGLEE